MAMVTARVKVLYVDLPNDKLRLAASYLRRGALSEMLRAAQSS
jgi:hypothetical protein